MCSVWRTGYNKGYKLWQTQSESELKSTLWENRPALRLPTVPTGNTRHRAKQETGF